MDIFSGPGLRDLRELWDAQSTYTYTLPPDTSTVADNKFTLRGITPPVVARGWECPKCGCVYAPGVIKCTSCGPKVTFTTGNSTK